MRRFTTRLVPAALAALALSLSRPAAADGYAITDLGTLPGKDNSFVWQQSVNDRGEVAVYANNVPDPNAFFSDETFLWSNGTITPLPGLPGATSTICYSLNNRGQGVGYSRQEGGFQHALLWDKGVRIQLPELPGDTRSNTYTLNEAGQVCGFSRHPDPNLPFQIRHATVWTKVGHTYQVTRLPGLTSGDAYDQAFSINNNGQVCGESGAQSGMEHAVLWDKNGIHDLGTLGGPTSTAVSINDKGQMAGFADSSLGLTLPFFYDNGVMQPLDIPAGDIFGLAQSINIQGQSVGFSVTDFSDLAAGHALLWDKHGVMTDLQTKIPADSGWQLVQACGINNRGQISGFGLHDGQIRAFLLTPVH